jgi:hypothetical protein
MITKTDIACAKLSEAAMDARKAAEEEAGRIGLRQVLACLDAELHDVKEHLYRTRPTVGTLCKEDPQ